MPKDDSQEVLAAEILEDARKRSERIVARGKAEAEKIIADARAQAKAASDRVLSAARDRAENRGRMLMRSVDHEVARRKLQAGELLVEQIMNQARTQLNGLSGDEYRRAALALAAAAIRRMPSDDFIVQLSATPEEKLDAASIGSDLAKAIAGTDRHPAVRIELNREQPRGVVVGSADGRLRWDNTFDGRLRRLMTNLRSLVMPILFGES